MASRSRRAARRGTPGGLSTRGQAVLILDIAWADVGEPVGRRQYLAFPFGVAALDRWAQAPSVEQVAQPAGVDVVGALQAANSETLLAPGGDKPRVSEPRQRLAHRAGTGLLRGAEPGGAKRLPPRKCAADAAQRDR